MKFSLQLPSGLCLAALSGEASQCRPTVEMNSLLQNNKVFILPRKVCLWDFLPGELSFAMPPRRFGPTLLFPLKAFFSLPINQKEFCLSPTFSTCFSTELSVNSQTQTCPSLVEHCRDLTVLNLLNMDSTMYPLLERFRYRR